MWQRGKPRCLTLLTYRSEQYSGTVTVTKTVFPFYFGYYHAGRTDMTQIISIVGRSESGKTTLIEKLIPEIKKRGYRVGTIKHAHHGFDIDKEGKDSWRHKAAGAETVLVSSPGKIAMLKDKRNDTLNDLKRYFDDMDIVITEGYKRENTPKIEVFRTSRHNRPVCLNDDNLIALVTDSDMATNVPKFALDEIEKLVDFIENRILAKSGFKTS